MSKRIVVCCDGTGNGFDHVDEESNVAKLYSSITVNSGQRCYYHPGVGTMGPRIAAVPLNANGRG